MAGSAGVLGMWGPQSPCPPWQWVQLHHLHNESPVLPSPPYPPGPTGIQEDQTQGPGPEASLESWLQGGSHRAQSLSPSYEGTSLDGSGWSPRSLHLYALL